MTAHEYRLLAFSEMNKASVCARAYEESKKQSLFDLAQKHAIKAGEYTRRANESTN